ncbi:MAG TPA: hypothetical protein VJ373_02525 [Desulfatiglandales bacterium]|nr:hypothetical protein [Desulfatiglandales bacterium]
MHEFNIPFVLHIRKLICLLCAVLFISIACIADTGLAREADKKGAPTGQASDEAMSPRKVKPEWKMPDFYPADGFDGMGRINEIVVNDGIVVIDDSEFRLFPYAEYHTPTYKNAPGALFKEGDQVGYILDSEKNITSMWLIVIKR